ncbi:MAG: hypothetical protein ABSD70_17415, partial [Terracidiphilus sp.]
MLALGAFPAIIVLAGCTSGSSMNSSGGTLSVTPGAAAIDTNCTGCNSKSSSNAAVEQFTASLSSGAVSGGDASSGAGTVSSTGQYTPPPYLTADSVQVKVTATSTTSTDAASSTLTITPGFLQPLTPENVALGSGGSTTVTGYIAEAGGSTAINYALSSSTTGSNGGQGSLGATNCTRSSQAFTYCSAAYSAPGTVSSTAATYIVATVGTSSSTAAAEVLLDSEGIDSNPATHQPELTTP